MTHRYFFWITLLILNLSFHGKTQSVEPFSIAQIMSAPFPSGMTASADGDMVAWVFNAEGVRNIWLSEAGSNASEQVTSFKLDDGHAIGSLQFTPDGESLVFVYGSDANNRGEHPNPTSDPEQASRSIQILNLENNTFSEIAKGHSPQISPDGRILAYISGGQVWKAQLDNAETPVKKMFHIRGSAGSVRWSPDGTKLAFVSRRGDHSYVGVYELAEHHLSYLNPTVDRDFSPAWAPSGEFIAFIRQPNVRQALPFMPRRSGYPWSVMVAAVDGSQTKKVWQADEGPGSVFRSVSASSQLFWSTDNHLVFPWEGDGWTHLYSISARGGEAHCLTPGDGEVQFVSMSQDRRSILYSSNIGDINRQHVRRVATNGIGEPEPVTVGSPGVEWAPVSAGNHIYCMASTGNMPAHPAMINRWGQIDLIAKSAIPEDFPSDKITPPEAVLFTATDGMEIHGQLFKPKNYDAENQYPAVLFFHGGSRRQMLLGFHHRGYYHNAFALNQYLANQGYLVLSVNFRSGIGYGMEFREALNYGARGASEYQDVVGAGLYMKGRTDVDPDNIGLWGGSYGGYLTALGLARASDLFAAGVDVHGVHDWNVVIRNFVPGYDAAKMADVARLAFDSSPMAYLEGWTSPVLLIHGDDDRNVPFSETVDIVESLRKRDVYFEQLIFPDEVHGFLLHSNWLAAYNATARFFDKFLKD